RQRCKYSESARIGRGGNRVVAAPVEHVLARLDGEPVEVDPHPAKPGRLHLVEDLSQLRAARCMRVDSVRRVHIAALSAQGGDAGEERTRTNKRRQNRSDHRRLRIWTAATHRYLTTRRGLLKKD